MAEIAPSVRTWDATEQYEWLMTIQELTQRRWAQREEMTRVGPTGPPSTTTVFAYLLTGDGQREAERARARQGGPFRHLRIRTRGADLAH